MGVTLKIFDFLTLVDYRKSVENCIKRYEVTDCYQDHMHGLSMHNVSEYFSDPTYTKYMTYASLSVLAMFVIPQVLFANHVKLMNVFKSMGVDAVEDYEGLA